MDHKEIEFYAKGRYDAMTPVTTIVYPHKVIATAETSHLTQAQFARALGREFPRHSFVLVSDNGVYYLADADRFTGDGLDAKDDDGK